MKEENNGKVRRWAHGDDTTDLISFYTIAALCCVGCRVKGNLTMH